MLDCTIHISSFYQVNSLVVSTLDQILSLVYMLDRSNFWKLWSSILFPYEPCCFPQKMLSNHCGQKNPKQTSNSRPIKTSNNHLMKLYFAIIKDKSFHICYTSKTNCKILLCLRIILYCFSTQIWIQRLTLGFAVTLKFWSATVI